MKKLHHAGEIFALGLAALCVSSVPWSQNAVLGVPLHCVVSLALLGSAFRFVGPAVRRPLVLAALVSALSSFPNVVSWPLNFVLAIVVYGVLLRLTSLGRDAPWPRTGEFSRRTLGFAGVVAVISSLALSVWWDVVKPNVAPFIERVRSVPLLLALAGGLLFALSNAAVEEFVFRFVFFEAIGERTSSLVAIGVTGIAFGLLHYEGIPGGAIGVGLATLYGFLLGALRVVSGGLLVVYVVHVLADLTIFGWVLVFSGALAP